MSEFHAKTPHATASEGLAQCPNVAARAGFEHAILRTKGAEHSNEPPHYYYYGLLGLLTRGLLLWVITSPITMGTMRWGDIPGTAIIEVLTSAKLPGGCHRD